MASRWANMVPRQRTVDMLHAYIDGPVNALSTCCTLPRRPRQHTVDLLRAYMVSPVNAQ
jgi:hypothetical protein